MLSVKQKISMDKKGANQRKEQTSNKSQYIKMTTHMFNIYVFAKLSEYHSGDDCH